MNYMMLSMGREYARGVLAGEVMLVHIESVEEVTARIARAVRRST